MKRILSFLLALVLVLGLCACGSGSAANTTDAAGTAAAPQAATFMAGFGKADITPQEQGVPMNGYSTDITKFAPGTGEQMVGDYLRLLNELHD